MLNAQTGKTKETPLFYALKMENSKDKVRMTKMLLGFKEVDLGI